MIWLIPRLNFPGIELSMCNDYEQHVAWKERTAEVLCPKTQATTDLPYNTLTRPPAWL